MGEGSQAPGLHNRHYPVIHLRQIGNREGGEKNSTRPTKIKRRSRADGAQT